MDSKTYGKKGEVIAVNYLKKQGYKILETNYKNKIGEIDIIAQQGLYLVFVEVKARLTRAFGDPSEAVDYYKQEKIRRVASLYLISKKKLDSPCRFDVVSILGDDDYEINHIIDAF